MKKEDKSSLLLYGIILLALIITVVCNNKFWKIGKQTTEEQIQNTNNTVYLESNNVIYNVLYEEQWLD